MSSSQALAAANRKRRQNYQARSLIDGVGFTFDGKRRGRSKVLRDSKHAGEAEMRKWRESNVFPRIEKEARLSAIFAWSDEHKIKGRAWGLLTPKQKRILQVMHDARDYATGALDLAYSTICRIARCCTQTLASAIAKFVDLDLIEKWRRTVPLDDPEPCGPRVVQIENAYFLKLPGEVARRVRRALGKLTEIVLPPVPAARLPTAHEKAALAKMLTAPVGDDRVSAARRQHHAANLIGRCNARKNAVAASSSGDSSS